jgi:AraC-like DNA-binding protein
MSRKTILLIGQRLSIPIENNSQLEGALEGLFDSFQQQKVSVMEGKFILRREPDLISLQLTLAFNYFLHPLGTIGTIGTMGIIGNRIQWALNFIHAHYGDAISINQIARSACLSLYHFCRLFRKEVGMSCWQYLNNFRIIKAKQLLSETDLSITQICYETGFSSLTHFERVFKQIEGQTPSEYRKVANPKKARFVVKKAINEEHFSLA